jgi:uncharacterized membrane protein
MTHLFDKRGGIFVLLYIGILAVALGLNYTAARALLAVPLVLIVPGYAITAALFPHANLGFAERLLFALGASLATVILGALLLNLLPWGLQPSTWAALLVGTTLVAMLIAWVRTRPAESHEPVRTSGRAISPRVRPQNLSSGFNFSQPLLLLLAVLVVGAALELAHAPAPVQGYQGYTLLWMLPGEASQPTTVRLGIRSKEFLPTSYKLQVTVNGQVIHEWPSLALKPNMQWQAQLQLPAAQLEQAPVEAKLYRLDQPEKVYRQVVLRPEQ